MNRQQKMIKVKGGKTTKYGRRIVKCSIFLFKQTFTFKRRKLLTIMSCVICHRACDRDETSEISIFLFFFTERIVLSSNINTDHRCFLSFSMQIKLIMIKVTQSATSKLSGSTILIRFSNGKIFVLSEPKKVNNGFQARIYG